LRIDAILGRIFLALVTVVLAFALLEYASRRIMPGSRSLVERAMGIETGIVRKPKPFVMFGGTPGAPFPMYDPAERLNAFGYRGKAPAPVKPPGEIRVFLLGGSTVVFGNPPLDVLLEQAFREHGLPQVRVYNYGVVSSNSGMDLSRIVFELSDFQPDLVVMYGGGNDLMHPPYFDPRPGYPFNFLAYENNPLVESNVRDYPALTLFAYGSHLLRQAAPMYFFRKLVPFERIREEAGWGTPAWQAGIASSYVRNLERADRVSGAFGARFIAFFQPLVYFKEPLAEQERALAGEEIPGYRQLRERVRSGIGTRGRLRPIPLVDLSDLFVGTPARVFQDQIHIEQPQYRVVADAMYPHLAGALPK
jgi:lysophospholipase L1-like esterase